MANQAMLLELHVLQRNATNRQHAGMY